MANYVTLLRCGHSVYYDPPPAKGDTVYCRRCGDWSQTRVVSQEVSWHCPVCHITRPHGTDELEARRAGRRHQRKYHHVVQLRRGYNLIETLGPEGQGELSVAGERIEWVRGHQGALRAAVEARIVHNGQS